MKNGWEVITLGEVVKLEYGKPLAKEDRTPDGDYGVYGANGIKNYSNKAYSKGPSIIVGRKGSAGELTFVTGDFWPLDVTYFTQHNSDLIELKFLMLLLEMANLPSMAKGVKPGINRNDVYALQIPLPPLDEQKRIVSILDKAFVGLDRARENAEANLKSARELFESGLDVLFASTRLSQYETSIGSFSRVFDGPHATPKTIEKGPVFLGISALVDGKLDLRKTRHVSDLDYLTWTKRIEPKARDVVFSYETRLGQAAIIPDGLKCCLGRRMGLVRLETDRVMPKFFLFQYLTPTYQKFLRSKVVEGTTVDRIHLKHFPNFPMFVPPLEIQKAVIKRLEEFVGYSDKVTVEQASKLQDISNLRRSLLQKAFAGELT